MKGKGKGKSRGPWVTSVPGSPGTSGGGQPWNKGLGKGQAQPPWAKAAQNTNSAKGKGKQGDKGKGKGKVNPYIWCWTCGQQGHPGFKCPWNIGQSAYNIEEAQGWADYLNWTEGYEEEWPSLEGQNADQAQKAVSFDEQEKDEDQCQSATL